MLPTTPGPADPRLRPQRHHQPVRRLRPRQRVGHRPALPAPPPPGVPAVPQAHRHCSAERPRPAPSAEQLRHAQDPGHSPVAAQDPRFYLHFTPTSSSWMNLVERWFAELTNRKLRRSAHRSVTELETDIRKWTSEWNKNPRPFTWTKRADEILETLAAYSGSETYLAAFPTITPTLGRTRPNPVGGREQPHNRMSRCCRTRSCRSGPGSASTVRRRRR